MRHNEENGRALISAKSMPILAATGEEFTIPLFDRTTVIKLTGDALVELTEPVRPAKLSSCHPIFRILIQEFV